jgi:indolepyruvate decarboxylase
VNRGGRTNEPNEVKTMSSTTTQRMTIGDFLLRRLKEAGIRHLFGVPGDYNLELLQQLQDTGALSGQENCRCMLKT